MKVFELQPEIALALPKSLYLRSVITVKDNVSFNQVRCNES